MRSQLVSNPGAPAVTDVPVRDSRDLRSSVTVRAHPSGPWMVVEIAGEMDVQAVALVAGLVPRHTRHLVFDLQRVTFMDATGLGLLVATQGRASEAGGCICLVAPSRSARRLLLLTGCARTFRTFESIEQVVSAPVDSGPGPGS